MYILLKLLFENAIVKLLLSKSKLNKSRLNKSKSLNKQATRAIAKQIGCLALRLSFATAYIATRRCTIKKYLKKFDSFYYSKSKAKAAKMLRRTNFKLNRSLLFIKIKKDKLVFVAFKLSYNMLSKTVNLTKLL
jgi:hypothetical protein